MSIINRNVLVTCQLTEGAIQKLSEYSVDNSDIRISAPPFNVKNAHKSWDDQTYTKYSVPSYPYDLQLAVMRLFKNATFASIVKKHELPELEELFDADLLHDKLSKLSPLTKHLASLNTENSLYTMHRVTQFIEMVAGLKSDDVPSFDDWNKRLNKFGIFKGWMNRLHYNEVLGIFGATPLTIADTVGVTFGADNKRVLGHDCIRWLSVALCGYRVKGCITDVVNLAYMMTRSDPVDQTEQQIVAVFNKFVDIIISGDVSELGWVPDLCLNDGEFDDCVVVAICKLVHEIKGTNITILTQLPTDGFDQLQSFTYASGCQAFLDADSRNGEVLSKLHAKWF